MPRQQLDTLLAKGNGPSTANVANLRPSIGDQEVSPVAALDSSPAEQDGGDVGLFPRSISKAEVIYVTCQLAIMVETGIPVSSALRGIVEQAENPSLRKVLADVCRSVEAGQDLSAALARYPKLFDNTYVSLVRSSEATGSLGETLDRVAGYLRKEVETRSKVRAALAYPTVMLAMAVGVTIFLLTVILPKFTPLFSRQGVQLPKPTVVMMALSACLMDYRYHLAVALAALIAGFHFGKQTPRGRQTLDWLKINMPILGPMFRKVAISRSIRTLGAMIGNGVPVLDALRLSADVAGNYFYQQLWRQVVDRVAAGKQICESLAGNPLIPSVVVQMIAAGEQTGKLDSVLLKVSNYYDHEVETSLKTVTSMLEPIMIAVMGVIVGGIGMALLLPIFSLSKTPT